MVARAGCLADLPGVRLQVPAVAVPAALPHADTHRQVAGRVVRSGRTCLEAGLAVEPRAPPVPNAQAWQGSQEVVQQAAVALLSLACVH